MWLQISAAMHVKACKSIVLYRRGKQVPSVAVSSCFCKRCRTKQAV